MRYITAVLSIVLLFCAAGVQTQAQTGNKNTETVVYDVSLNCDKCKAKIEKHIPFEKGVKDVDVNVADKQVTVTFDTRKNTVDGIAKAIEKLGYTCETAAE